MNKLKKTEVKLDFSNKYNREHSEQYFQKHQQGLARKLSNWRDLQLARKALKIAGNPQIVLDLPCGAGRFWPVLAENPKRQVIGADNSQDMLDIALEHSEAEIKSRFRVFQTSAFQIDMPDSSVDNIFCMRLIHHIGHSEHRLLMLREFFRVTKDTLIISLWVDGNYKSYKRKKLEQRNPRGPNQNRFVIPAKQIEKEFAQSGFEVLDFLDFIPYYAMWRVYILRKK